MDFRWVDRYIPFVVVCLCNTHHELHSQGYDLGCCAFNVLLQSLITLQMTPLQHKRVFYSSLCVPMVERSGLVFMFTQNRVYYLMSLEIA
jgi:hypothetical protein